MGCGNGQLSTEGPPLGTLEGVRLPRLLREMEGCGNGNISNEINLGSIFGPRLCKEPNFGGKLELL